MIYLDERLKTLRSADLSPNSLIYVIPQADGGGGDDKRINSLLFLSVSIDSKCRLNLGYTASVITAVLPCMEAENLPFTQGDAQDTDGYLSRVRGRYKVTT